MKGNYVQFHLDRFPGGIILRVPFEGRTGIRFSSNIVILHIILDIKSTLSILVSEYNLFHSAGDI